jgi:hypothetical protein
MKIESNKLRGNGGKPQQVANPDHGELGQGRSGIPGLRHFCVGRIHFAAKNRRFERNVPEERASNGKVGCRMSDVLLRLSVRAKIAVET